MIPIRLPFAGSRRQDFHPPASAGKIPGLARPEMAHQGQRFVLGKHPDLFQPAIHHIAETEIDDPINSGKGHGRLGPFLHQDIQTAADSAGEEEHQRFFCSLHRSTSPACTLSWPAWPRQIGIDRRPFTDHGLVRHPIVPADNRNPVPVVSNSLARSPHPCRKHC